MSERERERERERECEGEREIKSVEKREIERRERTSRIVARVF